MLYAPTPAANAAAAPAAAVYGAICNHRTLSYDASDVLIDYTLSSGSVLHWCDSPSGDAPGAPCWRKHGDVDIYISSKLYSRHGGRSTQ